MRFHTLAQRPPRAVETNRGGVGRNPEVTGKHADRDTVEDDPSQKRSLIGADLIELRYHARARHRYQHRHQHRGARLVQRRLFAAAAAADLVDHRRTIRDSHAGARAGSRSWTECAIARSIADWTTSSASSPTQRRA